MHSQLVVSWQEEEKKNVSKEGENNSQFMTRESEARAHFCTARHTRLLISLGSLQTTFFPRFEFPRFDFPCFDFPRFENPRFENPHFMQNRVLRNGEVQKC